MTKQEQEEHDRQGAHLRRQIQIFAESEEKLRGEARAISRKLALERKRRVECEQALWTLDAQISLDGTACKVDKHGHTIMRRGRGQIEIIPMPEAGPPTLRNSLLRPSGRYVEGASWRAGSGEREAEYEARAWLHGGAMWPTLHAQGRRRFLVRQCMDPSERTENEIARAFPSLAAREILDKLALRAETGLKPEELRGLWTMPDMGSETIVVQRIA